ncbi:MAG: ATP-binding cassette domain-containing protein [Pseudomonadota bacterium]
MPETVADLVEDGALPLMQANGLLFETGGGRLVDGLSFDIAEGRRTVVMGPNGAGKSLTLRLLHGLVQPTAGDVLWRGRPLDAAARANQAMVFQRPVLLRRSVLANMRFALAAAGVPRRDRGARALEALSQARLETLAHRPARVLSGGEQQRLAIARALGCRPQLLFLDEPTASLDPAATKAVEDLILTASDEGITVVMVTHDTGQARRLGQDLIFLHAGRVAETGLAAERLNQPHSPQLAAWLAGRLWLDGSDNTEHEASAR